MGFESNTHRSPDCDGPLRGPLADNALRGFRLRCDARPAPSEATRTGAFSPRDVSRATVVVVMGKRKRPKSDVEIWHAATPTPMWNHNCKFDLKAPDPTLPIWSEDYGFVYLIGTTGGLYKIGHAGNLSVRFASLRGSSPASLFLWRAWPTFNRHAIEKSLHRTFKAYRRQGEWFALPSIEAVHAAISPLLLPETPYDDTRIECDECGREVWLSETVSCGAICQDTFCEPCWRMEQDAIVSEWVVDGLPDDGSDGDGDDPFDDDEAGAEVPA